jgi:nitrate reductase gamma subunit
MNGMWLQIVTYISVIFIIVASFIKVRRIAGKPVHLRCELYPIAHEKEREHGGSYLEQLDWWTKPRRRSFFGMLTYIMREVLWFEKCYRNNRGLWCFTYPFHIGLFLLGGWLFLLFVGAMAMIFGVTESPVWITAVRYLTLGAGVAGFALNTIGSIGLLIKRSIDENLRLYSSPADYFNVTFILAIVLSGLSSWYFFDPGFAHAREFMKSLITFAPAATNPAMTIGILLLALFLVYMPFTHMMHWVTKYFAYHRVCWDDDPNLGGDNTQYKVKKLLDQPVTWSAPHIQPGKKWKEVISGSN